MFTKYLEKEGEFGKGYFTRKLEEMTDEQKQELLTLIEKMEVAGCEKPLSWAYSEVKEGIPQFARFKVLNELMVISDDVEGARYGAEDYFDCIENSDVDFNAMHEEMVETIGKDKLEAYLKAYGKGIISSVITTLDEGNVHVERDGFSWVLVKMDEDGKIRPDKVIGGLHESLYE